MADDLHEEFERYYAPLWPFDMEPFKRAFTGSPNYAMEKTQEAWLEFPQTFAAWKEICERYKLREDGHLNG